MDSQALRTLDLPEAPGVYFWKKDAEILYIGRATSLRDRVRSYFGNDLIATRGPLLVDMVTQAGTIDYIQTDSVLEAIILEANLIKKHQPKYNTKEKSNKSFNYVVITDEDFPRILLERGRNLKQGDMAKKYTVKKVFGPYPSGTLIRDALKIIRKIFPFRDRCVPAQRGEKSKPCFNAQIGLCPGMCAGKISIEEYAKTIRHLILFFSGKKKELIRSLEREMGVFAKQKKFEKAQEMKHIIFALAHIQDVTLVRDEIRAEENRADVFRIEAYDVAHISGTHMVGVMVVVENGETNKSDYRKFKIETVTGPNDTAALQEILTRRLTHSEWRLPDMIVVDGSKAQINTAEYVLKRVGKKIPVVAVTKDARHKPKVIRGKKSLTQQWSKAILLANSEAHRFAIGYHRKLRNRF